MLMINPATHALVFCPLLKISLVNPYLKILDLAKLFVADVPIKKIYKKIVLPTLRTLTNIGLKIAHRLEG